MNVAFVAGATGHTGRVVVDTLLARGATTVAHVRPDSSSLADWKARWEAAGAVVDTTAWEADAMADRLRALAPTHVFALLGTTRKRASREGMGATDAYERIDYGLTALLLRAAAECGSEPRFIYLSAAGLSAKTRNPYMRARVRIEEALQEGALPFVSARPSFIVGERDEPRLGERWAAKVADGALSVVGALGAKRAAARYASTDNATLGEALVRIALHPSTPRRHIAESETLRPDGSVSDR
ncbi:MAG: NAD-dependent epimerase/dehydratase family protein [Myxococcota bacterium]